MLKLVKPSVQTLTSHLQFISGYLEPQDYPNALGRTRDTMIQLHALAASLAKLANVGITAPEDRVVMAPCGSEVVTYGDVNVDFDKNEVRSLANTQVRGGHGNDHLKTK